MSKTWEFFEDIDELVYVTDIESQEIIYMNKKALDTFSLHDIKDVQGMKCHELFQNCSTPCAFCHSHGFESGHFKEMRYYNPILDKNFILKNKIIEEDEKKYCMSLVIDVSKQEQQSYMAQDYENFEAIINEGLRVSLQETSPSRSLEILLEYLGKTLSAERTYIFEKNDTGGDDNTYEWTSIGVTSEKDNLQNLSPEVCANWYNSFESGKLIIIENLEDIKEINPIQYDILKRQNIHSLVVVPLYDEQRVIGFYGVDNPKVHSFDYASNLLQITAHFIVSALKRRDLFRELQEKSYDILKSLNVDYVGIYHVDFDTNQCEIYRDMNDLYLNDVDDINFKEGYEETMDKYISLCVEEQDQAYLRKITKKDYVLDQLKKKNKFFARYQVKDSLLNVKNCEIHFANSEKESNGNVVIFAFRNVDSVVKQEEKYRLKQQRDLEEVLAGSRTGIWTIELEEGCEPRMYGDRTMCMLLGVENDIEPEECYCQWFNHIDSEYVEMVQEAVQEIIKTGRSEVVYPWHHPTLGKIYIRCGGIPDKMVNKPGLYLKGYHQDITETMVTRQKQEKKILEALETVQRANRVKSEFLSHMSHDIRTPINGILGMLEIIEKNQDNMEKQKDCRKKIRVAAEHLLSLINDVLQISKLESGESSFVEEPFDLGDILENCMSILSPKAEETGIYLELKESDLKHKRVVGSPLHLRQILINIIGNAIKYNQPNGQVCIQAQEISSNEDVAEYQFVIEDTGIGMSEEFQKHIFEPFTQENKNARTNYNGTGLGMSITKKLVDQMNGTIEIKSQLGKGSMFKIILPMQIDKNDKIQSVVQEENTLADISGMNVLLVEDNAINCEIVQYMLEDAGATVVTAENGRIAVDTFASSAEGTFDCILMDLMMPVMGGLEATQAIRALNRADAKTISIIALSANAFEEDIKKSIDAGMNEHLTKPVDIRQLFNVMDRLIKQNHS